MPLTLTDQGVIMHVPHMNMFDSLSLLILIFNLFVYSQMVVYYYYIYVDHNLTVAT